MRKLYAGSVITSFGYSFFKFLCNNFLLSINIDLNYASADKIDFLFLTKEVIIYMSYLVNVWKLKEGELTNLTGSYFLKLLLSTFYHTTIWAP